MILTPYTPILRIFLSPFNAWTNLIPGPRQCYSTTPQTQQKVYKSLKAGKCQHVLSWLHHDKLMLANLYAAKVRTRGRLETNHKDPGEMAARQIRQRFLADTSFQEALPARSHIHFQASFPSGA
jgi:hypothetical protein